MWESHRQDDHYFDDHFAEEEKVVADNDNEYYQLEMGGVDFVVGNNDIEEDLQMNLSFPADEDNNSNGNDNSSSNEQQQQQQLNSMYSSSTQTQQYHNDSSQNPEQQNQQQSKQWWVCRLCKIKAFDSYEDAISHEAICYDANPLKSLRDNDMHNQQQQQENWTVCRICNSKAFASQDAAMYHESTCGIVGSNNSAHETFSHLDSNSRTSLLSQNEQQQPTLPPTTTTNTNERMNVNDNIHTANNFSQSSVSSLDHNTINMEEKRGTTTTSSKEEGKEEGYVGKASNSYKSVFSSVSSSEYDEYSYSTNKDHLQSDDPFFRLLLLDTVQVIITNKRPCKKSLYELLKITTPNLVSVNNDDNDDLDINKCNNLYQKLKLHIHPDVHSENSSDYNRATKIYQGVEFFYDQCIAAISLSQEHKKEVGGYTSSPSSSYNTAKRSDGNEGDNVEKFRDRNQENGNKSNVWPNNSSRSDASTTEIWCSTEDDLDTEQLTNSKQMIVYEGGEEEKDALFKNRGNSNNNKKRCCFRLLLCFVCLLVACAIVFVSLYFFWDEFPSCIFPLMYFDSNKCQSIKGSNNSTSSPSPAPTEQEIIIIPMEPYEPNFDCNELTMIIEEGIKDIFPHITQQCECNGVITILPLYTIETYDILVTTFSPILFYNENDSNNAHDDHDHNQSWNFTIESCNPMNLALLFLATGAVDDNNNGNYGLLIEQAIDSLLQRYIIANFYYQLNGPKWRSQEFWLSTTNECTWKGITCNTEGAVTKINLNNNNATGKIPTDLGRLMNLETLSIDQNGLFGAIPTELFYLGKLTELSLSVNELDGELTSDIGYATNLRRLLISDNNINGAIPVELFTKLPKLEDLRLSVNDFVGKLPTEIGFASSLQVLRIFDNSFEGSIPSELGQITNLIELNLGYNHFSEQLPSEMYQLTKLISLNIEANNDITGRLPTDFALYTNLQYLSISHTNIRSRIFSYYQNLTKLKEFRASNTSVGGYIPTIIGNLTNLEHIDLSNSRFRQAIPSEIGKLTKLTRLALNDNTFEENIPTELGLLTNLATLLLSGNMLDGSIPSVLGQLTRLEQLTLDHNLLTGVPPEELCERRDESLGVLEILTTDCPTRELGIVCPPTCCTWCSPIEE